MCSPQRKTAGLVVDRLRTAEALLGLLLDPLNRTRLPEDLLEIVEQSIALIEDMDPAFLGDRPWTYEDSYEDRRP